MSEPVRVVCAVIIRDNEILCVRRAPPHHLAGLWEFPGGKIEQGEEAQEALRREIYEELGVTIAVGEQLPSVVHQYPTKRIELIPYCCTIVAGELKLSEHDQMLWLTIPGLSSLSWAPADQPIIQCLIDRLRSDGSS